MSKQIRKQKPTVESHSRWSVRAFAAFVFLTLLAACNDSPTGPTTGSLVVAIEGLPDGTQNVVSVNGPTGSGFSRVLSATDTLRDLVPGSYTIHADVATSSSGSYSPASASQQVVVAKSTTPAQVSVEYSITTGSIALTVNGLPTGTPATISISGPEGYQRGLTESTTLTNLTPGAYSISNSTVNAANGHVYSPTPISTALTVVASESPRNVTTTYTLSTGSLEVAVTGLPQNGSADVLVSGPAFSRRLTATTTFAGLFPGTYIITSSDVLAAGAAWTSSPPWQSIEVAPSLTPTRATVTYVQQNAPPPPDFNLSIDGMYLTQAVQTYAGSVPLVAGIPALVRVFVKASAPNTLHPTVRVRLYNGSSLLETVTVQPNTPGVPTTIAEGNLFSSWNAIVPAMHIQPGLRIQADVDPTNTVAEADEGDNAFPASGNPADVRVESTTPLSLTFVPVFQTATGLTGNITTQNLDDFTAFMRKVLPIRDYVVTLREPFTTSAPALESNSTNSWFQVLGEINALRVADGRPDYYMGIVGTTYTSGIAGLAFVPGRAAVSWDRLPNATSIAAHELSHNLGRLHAPCGGVATPDPAYPYAFGAIGVYGYDITQGVLKPPGTSDLMGYCGFGWISDYNYFGILDYRLATPGSFVATRASASRLGRQAGGERFVQSGEVRPSLVVWGRIEGGRPILEPAFTATTRPQLPARNGPFRIEALATNNQVIFAYSFEADEPADVTGGQLRHFAFAIPVDAAVAQSIATLRLTTETGARSQLAMSASAPSAAAIEATITRPGEVMLRVRDARVRMAVVRDRTTRRIVAFVRGQGPGVSLRSGAVDFDVELSDGVRSTVRAVRAIRR